MPSKNGDAASGESSHGPMRTAAVETIEAAQLSHAGARYAASLN
jgi:hypothetical protein